MSLHPIEGLRTQISGKYSPENSGLFDMRCRLMSLGVEVEFPAGDAIVEYSHDFAITTPDERSVPFHVTEDNFLESIERSNFHVVYNLLDNEEGYIGESTAVETVRALSVGVPTVWLRPPGRLSPYINSKLKVFVERAKDSAYVSPLDTLSEMELRTELGKLATRSSGVLPWEGGVIANEYEEEVFWDVYAELRGQYAHAWESYQE